MRSTITGYWGRKWINGTATEFFLPRERERNRIRIARQRSKWLQAERTKVDSHYVPRWSWLHGITSIGHPYVLLIFADSKKMLKKVSNLYYIFKPPMGNPHILLILLGSKKMFKKVSNLYYIFKPVWRNICNWIKMDCLRSGSLFSWH